MKEVKSRKNQKACFFDLDDTLYDQLVPFKNAVLSLGFDKYSIDFSELFKTVRHYSDTLWKEAYCTGNMTLEDLRVQRLVRAFKEFQLNLSVQYAEQMQQTYLKNQQKIVLFSGVMELIKTLQQQGYLVGILSNGPVTHQLQKLEQLGILNKVIPNEFVFVSDGVGIAKPDERIFMHVQRKLVLSPKNCFYVGDSWVNDVIPSAKAGWNSVWFNYRQREPLTDFQDYQELLDYEQKDLLRKFI